MVCCSSRLVVRGAATAARLAAIALLAAMGTAAAGPLEVQFASVGQADAVLITCPGGSERMLIDTADTRYPESAKQFRDFMTREFAGRQPALSVVIASHPHTDHIGSMLWVLENYRVRTYVDNGEKFESAGWSKLDTYRKKLLKQGRLQYIDAKKARSAQIPFCDNEGVTVEIFTPWSFGSLSDTNDRSVVVKLTHRNVSFLFVGDAEGMAEAVMLNEMDPLLRKKLRSSVLKVGHHGSDTSSTAKFVMAVGPQIAVISSGARNVGTNAGYKHPRYSTIDTYASWFANVHQADAPKPAPKDKIWAYDAAGKSWRQHDRPGQLWLTVQDGTIVVQSDGNKLNVETK